MVPAPRAIVATIVDPLRLALFFLFEEPSDACVAAAEIHEVDDRLIS
jgi:hypothetical protein